MPKTYSTLYLQNALERLNDFDKTIPTTIHFSRSIVAKTRDVYFNYPLEEQDAADGLAIALTQELLDIYFSSNDEFNNNVISIDGYNETIVDDICAFGPKFQAGLKKLNEYVEKNKENRKLSDLLSCLEPLPLYIHPVKSQVELLLKDKHCIKFNIQLDDNGVTTEPCTKEEIQTIIDNERLNNKNFDEKEFDKNPHIKCFDFIISGYIGASIEYDQLRAYKINE